MKYKRTWLLLLLPVTYALSFISSKNTDFSQWYSLKIYPMLSIPINTITSVVPFSLMELSLILFVLTIMVCIVYYIVKLIKHRNQWKNISIRFLLNFICSFSVLYFLFVLFSGINYHRNTFAQTYNYTISPSSKTDLIALCEDLTVRANTLRDQLDGISTTNLEGFNPLANESVVTFSKLGKDYDTLSQKYNAPKPVAFSKLMSYMDITGVFFPFTFEANINTDTPAYLIPATMLHELSHVHGYMREDEANFIAYLASTYSDNNYFRYSGVMLAYIYATNSLYNIDANAHLAITDQLSPKVKNDLVYNNHYWKQFDTKVSAISNTLNDTYLKINDQADGVRSYGKMVDLLISDYKKRHRQ